MKTQRSLAWTAALALVSMALALPRTSHAQYIDLPGTQPGDLDTAAPMDSSTSCGLTCHFSDDPTTPSAMPYDDYVGSMMGNTMRDPLFLAALTVAEQDHAGVGDYCLRCHTPPGFVGGRTRSSATAALGSDLTMTDLEGDTCDSCHRMLTTPNLGNAQYVLSLDETRFGPYDTIDSIRHTGAASTWLADSRFCGTCHEITNPVQPLLRADGTDTGERFPLDSTYREWANSDFAIAGSPDAKSCQDCHLPRIDGQAYVATNTTALLRDQPRRHEFAGANAWMIRLLEGMRGDVASGDFYNPPLVPYYENAAQHAEESLHDALALEIVTAPAMATPGASVEIVARVTNHAGHRVPTGYADGRRVWLAVDLTDASGHTTSISGAYDDATAQLDETDPQLHLYEAQQGRVGTGADGHIALHDTVVRDTRLPPSGFRPPPGVEPVGVDYSGGAGGSLRNWDDAHYVFTVPATALGPLTVRVRARYQSTTREYVEFLASENHTDSRGTDLRARYEASGRAAPFDMVEATTQITLPTPTPDASAPDVGSDVQNDAASFDAAPPEFPRPRGEGCGCRIGVGSRETRIAAWLVVLASMAGGRWRVRRRRA